MANRILESLVSQLLASGADRLYERAINELGRVLLAGVSELANGNLSRSSPWLGLSRTILRSQMRAISLHLEKVVLEDDSSDAAAS